MERKLLRCNVLLIIVAGLTAASSIMLESLHGNDFWGLDFYVWIWVHVALGILCLATVCYHVYLHWKKPCHWLKKVIGLNSNLTKWLSWSFLLTVLTGIIATICICYGMGHTSIGGIHGKIGLFVILLMALHLLKRWTWFKKRKKGKPFRPMINHEKCIRCNLCVKRCPAQVFERQGKQVVASRTEYCLQCKKCVIHCPKHAIEEK